MSKKKAVGKSIPKPEAEPKLAAVKKTHVLFRSRNMEGVEFAIRGIRASQSKISQHIEWLVPIDQVKGFEGSPHVVRQRVIRVND